MSDDQTPSGDENVTSSEGSDRRAMFEVLKRRRDELRKIVPNDSIDCTPAESPGQRLALAAGHAQNGIDELRRMFDIADDAAAQAHLDEQTRKLADFARRNGVGKYARFLSTKAGAKRYGRDADADFHALTHQFVHGSEVAITLIREPGGPDDLLLRDRMSKLWIQLGVALFASLSLVDATRGVADVFGWQGVDVLAAIQDELDAVQQRVARP